MPIRHHQLARVLISLRAVCFAASVVLVAVPTFASAASLRQDGAPAAYIAAGGETYLLQPDGTTSLLTRYPMRVAGVGRVALDPSGTLVATTRPDGATSEVILVSVADGGVTAVPGTHERNCGAPIFHPDRVHLIAVCDPGRDYFGRSIDLFHGDQGYVRTLARGGTAGIQFVLSHVAIAPDGGWAIAREHLGDYAVRHWRLDLATGQVEPLVLPGPPHAMRVEHFLVDGRILATRCDLCVEPGAGHSPELRTDILILEAGGGTEAVLAGIPQLIYSAALSPSGETLLYATGPAPEPTLWELRRSTGHPRAIGLGAAATYPQPSTGSRDAIPPVE